MKNNAVHGHLTTRDIALLMMVFSYGGCAIEHIRSRFFPTSGARSACYARVARLVEIGVLSSVRLPSRSGVGSGRAFLTLTAAGREIVAAQLDLTRSEVRRSTAAANPLFMAHHLAICSFRVAIELAATGHPRLSLEEWIPEHELRRAPLIVREPTGGQSMALVADGAFVLARDGLKQRFELEMDMGTIAPKRLRVKLRGYLAAKAVGPVLFVGPGPARQRQIVLMGSEEAARLRADSSIIWVTTIDQIHQAAIVQVPIWQVVGGPLISLDGQTVRPIESQLGEEVS